MNDLLREKEKNDKVSAIISPKRATPKKPYAPLAALLPATRVKVTIDYALELTNEIVSLEKNKSNIEKSIQEQQQQQQQQHKMEIITRLEQILIEQKDFMKAFNNNNNSNNKSEINIRSNSKLYEDTYREKIQNIPATDIPLALLTQAGDKRQFKILQQRQRKLEKNSPIREAFNYYSRQLQFDTEYYVLNANVEEKKRMIRNDALPDITSVIVSDLDLRDLVRNQILDAFDDVKAEFLYQKSKIKTENSDWNLDEFDALELQSLLMRAQKECNEWFSFIEENDIQKALQVVSEERENRI